MPDLLIELFSEEIPARMQAKAAEDLRQRVTDGLVEAGLTYAGAASFSTPRRLTLAIEGMLAQSPTLREERKGPRVDAPEKAIEGFLRGAGVSRDDLEVRDEKKGQVYFAVISKPGRPAEEIVAEVLEQTIRNFPWPKSMRWGAGSLRWVRPLHSILCLMTNDAGEAQIVPMDVDGITAGDSTEGHRFMAPGRFAVSSFEDYAAKLKRAYVVLDPEERAQAIWQEASNLAFAAGMELVEDKGLLREVAGLVEWPVPLMGAIDEAFLGLPPEVLQTSMKEHQKFFSVKSPKTGRIEKFVTVANRETADHGATILAGNQKVLSARLADAKFFWENDLREAEAGGTAWLASLDNVTFHNKLGSQAARIDRIAALAREIAGVTGADADLAEQAARWAKADLSSEMVYEFPELQGLMGRYYAEKAGLPAEVAGAAQEHYSPLGPSDDVPTAPVSVTVALADKLDTLTGFWAIDEKPTGSKDPFALRRAALGVIRLVLENGINANFRGILGKEIARKLAQLHAAPRVAEAEEILITLAKIGQLELGEKYFDKHRKESIPELGTEQAEEVLASIVSRLDDLFSFIHDRLKVYLRDEGLRHDVIDACLAMEGNDDLALVVKRARALGEMLGTEDGENLLQGFKRANNILSQAEDKDGVEYSYGADVKFAETEEERALFAALDAAEPKIAAALKAQDFNAAMAAMAALRAPIDAFFEAVQVNTDKDVVRRNRLNLLSRIRGLVGSVADLTRVEG
ncbi:glycine--tRNA ligase subunit beta [Roseovarius nubinhibens]|uniref:glycine--tRNA ligase subunit beta n=1 Tax=Roseovarius nubinhibens TaxID=314263 RepID=UPI001C082A76|nr:glycine--tRNA ligase subunit beta [Roseovarius nubinhibens]MBU2998446.1 glycine--tRNA ligase subunit beta [Roseovarius nubinhibens]